MTEGSVVTDCWGELFYVTPGLGLELGFDGPKGFPLSFQTELGVAMFLGTLSSFDLSLLNQRFSPKAKLERTAIQRAIMRGRLHVFPMNTPISLVNAVQNGGRSTQSAFTKSSLGATNTNQLSTYGSASNDLQCVNRTQEVIRSDIRSVLRQIVEQERIESRKIEKGYKNKSALGKTGAHIQHFSRGLHQATESFLTWLKDVNDVVSLTQRILRVLIAVQAASKVETDNRYELYERLLSKLEKKELVEVLGFDPSLVTVEKITEVYSLAKLVHDDHATQLIIKHFIQDYIKAQHQLEWTEISGGATFEIILTAFIAVVTGGVGAIASLGAQAKKLSQLKKLGELLSELLSELAELLKKVPKAKRRTLREQKALEEKKERKKEENKSSGKVATKENKSGDNSNKEKVLRTAEQDRAEITKLAKAGKIDEARNILKPQVEVAKNATTPTDKKIALDAIIERLDVSSSKEKVFWSGDVQLAGEYASKNGKTILEQTPGGSVINEWSELNDMFSWDANDMGPHGWDLWGGVSKNYADGAVGDIETIQTADKFPAGGPTWKNKEWPSLFKNPEVGDITIHKIDSSGNVLESLTVDSKSNEALEFFGSPI
jgi:hypothetical protein